MRRPLSLSMALSLSLSLSLSTSVALVGSLVSPTSTPCVLRPVSGSIVGAFRAPDCPWCPGNVSVDFATEPGRPVGAPTPGTVTFAGDVAGTSYVSIEPEGWVEHLVTVGGVEPVVAVGDRVVFGQRIGRADGGIVGLSLRRPGVAGPEYLDPLGRPAQRVGRGRLVPRDGTAWRRFRARVACPDSR